jgi:hypothetical protein
MIMNSSSRDPHREHQEVSAPAPPSVPCDLCGWHMPVPDVCRDGLILGLLVCSQCTEDAIDARAFEPRAEVGLVGGRG